MGLKYLFRESDRLGWMVEDLTEESSEVRWWAAVALGEIGSEKAVNPLKKALKDEGRGIDGKVKGSMGCSF